MLLKVIIILHLYRNQCPNDYQNIDVIFETELRKGAMGHYSDEDKIHFNYNSKHTIYIITDDF